MIINGDSIEELKKMEENSIDTIITDPPYGLSFMGKKWDYDVPSVDFWKEALRVLKPGGTLLTFAGSRTQHRMAVNVEDAGFELKDTIMWLYGSGFPKATDISKQLDKKGGKSIGKDVADLIKKKRLELGYSTIKLAELGGFYGKTNHGGTVSNWETGRGEITLEQFNKLITILELDNEPIIEAERKIIGKDKNWGDKGTVPLSGYKEFDITESKTPEAKLWNGWKSHGLKPAYEPIIVAMKPNDGTYANNALKHGVSGLNIDGGRIDYNGEKPNMGGRANAKMGGDQDYGFKIEGRPEEPNTQGRFPANIILDEEAGEMLDEQTGELKSGKPSGDKNASHGYSGNYGTIPVTGIGDKGGASRFFYCAKASKKERNEGCEGLEKKAGGSTVKGWTDDVARGLDRNRPTSNYHPTVKPLALMEYLCTLTKTPTGGIVLDPFAGSGTTGVACQNTGRDFILIEREEEYIPIIEARLKETQPKLL